MKKISKGINFIVIFIFGILIGTFIGYNYMIGTNKQDSYGYPPGPGTPDSIALSYSHWASIQKRDITETMSQYTDSSVLHWIDDNLEKNYVGKDEIRSKWLDFFNSSKTISIPNFVQVTGTEDPTGNRGANVIIDFEVTNRVGIGETKIVTNEISYEFSNEDLVLVNEFWIMKS